MTWRDFFGELMTPSDFNGDAYGELTNQLSHTLLGVALAILTCAAYGAAFGEMPVRVHVVGLIAGIYLAVELAQVWKPSDSGFDWLMVMCGAVFPLVTLHEIEPPAIWYKPQFEANFLAFLGVFVVWSALLAYRVKKRL